MAELLEQQRWLDSIDVYKYLQARWPYEPNNPVYQNEIAKIFGEKIQDMDAYREIDSEPYVKIQR